MARHPPWRHWFILSVRNGFCLLWLILVLATSAMLAIGGQPDPPGLGHVLDGPWRFHAGDNPAGADPRTDDRSWDRIILVSNPDNRDGDVGIPGYLAGWRARGYPALDGYGWYRRQVTLPRQGNWVVLGPPLVDDAYEMFWNGHRIGGVGRPPGSPDVTSTRPTLMRLPASAAGQGLLAIRAFMQPGFDRDGQSGGLRTAPTIASDSEGAALYRAEWRRTIAGYIVDAVEPAAMLLLALIAVLVGPTAARPGFARWAALGLVLSACLPLGNAIIAWTDLISLRTLLRQNGMILAPMAKLAWTIAWNHWTRGPGHRLIAMAALIAWIAVMAGALGDTHFAGDIGRAVFALCLVAIAIRIALRGGYRLLALAAILLIATGLFASDLSAWGVPGIWFPFNIGVSRSQYAYALALPLLAVLLTAGCQSSSSFLRFLESTLGRGPSPPSVR
jgi:hypothetical protein